MVVSRVASLVSQGKAWDSRSAGVVGWAVSLVRGWLTMIGRCAGQEVQCGVLILVLVAASRKLRSITSGSAIASSLGGATLFALSHGQSAMNEWPTDGGILMCQSPATWRRGLGLKLMGAFFDDCSSGGR